MQSKVQAQETFEGDGVVVNRLFPIAQRMNLDPFVLWDHFNLEPGHGFPDHPHRGFEAITYLFSGGMNHADNLGNNTFVSAGGAQVFCAGSGLVHSEMPAEKVRSSGIQLWINLAKSDKNIDPSYQQIQAEQLPIEHFDGGRCVHIVGGGSPIKLHSQITYQHLILASQSSYSLALQRGTSAIIYVVKGAVQIETEVLESHQAWLIEDSEQDALRIAVQQDSELMFCMGAPRGEPIRQRGPFVD